MFKYCTSVFSCLLLAGIVLTLPAVANAQTQLEKPTYVSLSPSFVTNYGDTSKLRYLKVDISVRVESLPASHKVDTHLPQIRHHLILLLSNQADEGVNTHEGRQKLRADALVTVQKILKEEEGEVLATDLLFDNFIVQS